MSLDPLDDPNYLFCFSTGPARNEPRAFCAAWSNFLSRFVRVIRNSVINGSSDSETEDTLPRRSTRLRLRFNVLHASFPFVGTLARPVHARNHPPARNIEKFDRPRSSRAGSAAVFELPRELREEFYHGFLSARQRPIRCSLTPRTLLVQFYRTRRENSR